MDADTSWFDDELDDNRKGTGVFHPCLELIYEDDKETNHVSIDSVLPNDLLEQILASLPFACISKSSCVCKKWNEIVHSRRFMLNISGILSQKPWYFMFTSSDEPIGYAYDPTLRKWYCFELPCIRAPSWYVASSCGLVCVMNSDSRIELCVCNPFTKDVKRLEEPLGKKFFDYAALAFSVDRSSHCYTVVLMSSKRASEDFVYWDISIHVYFSKTVTWTSPVKETLADWRVGEDGVICDGILYILVHSTREMGRTENRHALLAYNLYNQCSEDKLIDTLIQVPCFLTCGRLMNIKDKLVMVGGIGRRDRPGIIKGIGIWVLRGREWEEVSRMPHKFFQGFGEFDDVFASSGSGDLIYIQSYGSTALLVFDVNLKHWSWSQKCPVTKRFPLQLFTGFCFEPRLDISP
ncbi:F-box/kelch-repeat protein At3g61590-like [Cornus florida]|uniref:F-box/kelch-repeat protein At3g61590-like n=1 Tax=Cornus florida TaxID=4283 RepID=UPI002899DF8F|nr:F-box/kelch-repeat protein At3g61590-like [Cornus florida]XP_059662257.1 F-box/kelch-repeat protein At3g61590-like [Cornus florida]